MADWMSGAHSGVPERTQVSENTPSVARMYDYFLGGKDNFGADRRASEEVSRALPTMAEVARSNRDFLRRAVLHVAGCGVDQFLDLGAGLPTEGNVHEIAQSVIPTARVVYVDHDPVVISHGRALLTHDERTAVIQADMREPDRVLGDPAVTKRLDLGRPVCVLFVAVLHFLTEEEDPAGLVRAYFERLPPGSHVILSHAAMEEQRSEEVSDAYRMARVPLFARTREQVTALLDGMEIVEPGVVRLHEWRPAGGEYATDAGWTAVARKGAES